MERRKHAENKYPDKFYKYCFICSEFSTQDHPDRSPVFHNHFSSLFERTNASVDRWGEYCCTTCKITPHSCFTGVRIPVLVTSSILHNWQHARTSDSSVYPGNSIHIETISIPGATIPTLRHALVTEFGQANLPVDVLWVSGLNDVIKGLGSTRILDQLSYTKNLVLKWCNHNSTVGNTFRVSSLPLPPSLSRLAGDKRPEVKVDHTDELIKLNEGIKKMNLERAQPLQAPVPMFHSWGSSVLPKTKHDNIKVRKNHRMSEWRENTPNKMLHLADRVRIRMGRSVVSYYRRLYGIE